MRRYFTFIAFILCGWSLMMSHLIYSIDRHIESQHAKFDKIYQCELKNRC